MIKTFKKIFAIALVSIASMPAMGQDLLANQAPLDRKMKTVDSVALYRLIQLEQQYGSPAADLYNDWDNYSAHRESALPDTFRIDLRGFAMPTESRVLTSNFGARWGRQHKGLDIKVYIGDTIRAAFSGKVRVVRYEAGGYGNFVVIRHHNGLETIYGHMSKHLVTPDQDVRAGEPIGLGGNTGRSTGSHLHFETRLCGVALNPALLFDFRNQDVTGDFYTFRRSTYSRESVQANRLRGVNGASFSSNDDDMLFSDNSSSKKARRNVASNTRFHKVKKGETLYSIARKRNTTVAEICKLNRIGKNMKLRPGQILKYN
jgi:murein DD-endopeptidase MepM/ murein hydrolase activator NlpD